MLLTGGPRRRRLGQLVFVRHLGASLVRPLALRCGIFEEHFAVNWVDPHTGDASASYVGLRRPCPLYGTQPGQRFGGLRG